MTIPPTRARWASGTGTPRSGRTRSARPRAARPRDSTNPPVSTGRTTRSTRARPPPRPPFDLTGADLQLQDRAGRALVQRVDEEADDQRLDLHRRERDEHGQRRDVRRPRRADSLGHVQHEQPGQALRQADRRRRLRHRPRPGIPNVSGMFIFAAGDFGTELSNDFGTAGNGIEIKKGAVPGRSLRRQEHRCDRHRHRRAGADDERLRRTSPPARGASSASRRSRSRPSGVERIHRPAAPAQAAGAAQLRRRLRCTESLKPPDATAERNRMDLIEVLHTAVERGASDLHLKVGQPPIVRIDGDLRPLDGLGRARAGAAREILREVGASAPARLAALRRDRRARHRLPAARACRASASTPSASAATSRSRSGSSRARCRASTRCGSRRASAAWPRSTAGSSSSPGATGVGKTTTLAVDARPHQPHAAPAHRHDRGSDRDPPRRRGLHRQPARGRARHGLVQRGAAPRAAPGPRRDPDRRAARQRDRRDGAPGGRVRAPRASRRCTRVDAAETVGRLVEFFPADQAAAGALDPRRRAPGRRQPAPAAAGRRRPRRRGRGDGHQQPDRRADPREPARGHPRGDRGRRVLRHADAVGRR